MKAWLLDDFTGLSALRLDESVSEPSPGPGAVRIKVWFAALNPADRFLAERLYPARPELPHILGRDGCGAVDAVGAGVSSVRAGERVVILRGEAGVEKRGTFGEYVVVPEAVVARAPDDWSDAEAAAAPLVYETAHQALTQWGPLDGPSSPPAGSRSHNNPATILISGVTGGVGIASLHLAKAWGHRVIGLTRTASKHETLKRAGCDLILHPDKDDLKREVKAFTDGAGVDLAIDNIAGPLFERMVDVLGQGGRLSVVGMLGGLVPNFNTAQLIFKRGRIGGVHVGDYDAATAQSAWREIVAALSKIGAKPLVDKVFPFERLPDAFAHLEAGPLGKVVLHVDPQR
jgi:NADPH:quinone reductase